MTCNDWVASRSSHQPYRYPAMRLRFQHGRADDLETLHPAYFAMVVATSIVAIAAMLNGIPALPTILFGLNACFSSYLSLRQAFASADIRMLSSPMYTVTAVGLFFTIVAASGVFGSQLVLQMGAQHLALFFWILTAALWFVVTYGVVAVLMVKADKPSLADRISGGWLVIVVATQSVFILTVLILPAGLPAPLMFAALILWLGGGVLYLWLMTLSFFRYTFLPMSAEDLTPPYWINMGAVAISTLVGATLLQESALSPTVTEVVPFVKGFTLFFWTIGSWWILILLVLGVWRYLICGVPLAYDPLYWAASSHSGRILYLRTLAKVLNASYLMRLSVAFMILAIAAWIATFGGLVDTRLHTRGRPIC